MTPVIAQHQLSIAGLCRQYGVYTLDLFGSAASGKFDPLHSDLDFMVEFADHRPEGAADRYFGLLEGLQTVLGCPIDLIVRGAIRNPYFLRAVDRDRLNLYAA